MQQKLDMAHHFLLLFFLMFAVIEHVASESYRYTDESEKLTAADGRTRGIRDDVNKDFVLGGLIPVHEKDPNFRGGRCGKVYFGSKD